MVMQVQYILVFLESIIELYWFVNFGFFVHVHCTTITVHHIPVLLAVTTT